MASVDKIYCIRFAKLPPASVVVGVPFDLAISVVDDVGVDLANFGLLHLRLQCSHLNPLRSQHPILSIATLPSKNPTFTIDSAQGIFHKITAVLHLKKQPSKSLQGHSLKSLPTECYISVSLDASAAMPTYRLRGEDQDVIRLVGERSFIHLSSYEETALVLQSCSGAVRVCSQSSSLPTPTKVQTTEVLLHLPNSHTLPAIRIVETPGKHAIGGHLWHSSLVLASCILQNEPEAILNPKTRIIELGAGCGLVSMAVAAMFHHMGEKPTTVILATDLPEIAESTLSDCLAANAELASYIQPQALIWGSQVVEEVIDDPAKPLTILASDVLYNSDSHADFLATLLALFEAVNGRAQVMIAYRHRIQGDDGFWAMAKAAGLHFWKIHQFADIQLWQCKGRT